MISLANDLVRKSNGHIHTMPVIAKKPKAKKPRNKFQLTGLYVDENGKEVSIVEISKKHNVSQCKIRRLFLKHDYKKVYELIGIDARANNGQKEVYALPCGKWVSAQAVADHYQVSRSVIQRAWTSHGKCPIKANNYLTDRFLIN